MQDDRERTQQDSGLSTEDLAGTSAGGQDSPAARASHAAFPGEATGDADAQRAFEPAAGSETEATGGTRGDVMRGDVSEDEQTTVVSGDGTRQSTEPRLLDVAQEKEIRDRWQTIQTGFVDDPRDTVQAADALVAELMQRLAAFFAERRQGLEERWNRGEQVETEDLRIALQQYRSFFNRLLTT